MRKKEKKKKERKEKGKGKVLTSLNRARPRCTQWTSPIPRCPSASSQTCHSSSYRPPKKRTRLDLPRKWRKCSEIPKTVSKEAIATANCEPTALVDWHKDRDGVCQGSWWLHVHILLVQFSVCLVCSCVIWRGWRLPRGPSCWPTNMTKKRVLVSSSIPGTFFIIFKQGKLSDLGFCQAESQRRAKRPRTGKLPWDWLDWVTVKFRWTLEKQKKKKKKD